MTFEELRAEWLRDGYELTRNDVLEYIGKLDEYLRSVDYELGVERPVAGKSAGLCLYTSRKGTGVSGYTMWRRMSWLDCPVVVDWEEQRRNGAGQGPTPQRRQMVRELANYLQDMMAT